MDYVISCKYTQAERFYGSSDHYNQDAFVSKKSTVNWPRLYPKDVPEEAKRWKTKEGAEKFLNECKSKLEEMYFKPYGGRKQATNIELKITQIKSLPPPKFTKKKMNAEQLTKMRLQIIDKLFERGWKENTKYTHGRKAIDKNGTGYVIDRDEHYAISLNASVLTVHDASRQFCKVVSMGYNEIEIKKDELVCGKLALKF